MKSKTIVKLGTVPHDVVDLIDYQPDAIVSREIVKGETGSVTVFAFDALVQVLDGETQITIAGKAHTVKAGQLIVMPANKPHALQATKRFKMLLVMVRS